MSGFDGLIDTVALNAARANPEAPGDFRGEDGLLYCGKCKTPKEKRLPGLEKIVPCICRCKEEAAQSEDTRRRRAERFNYCRDLPIYRLHDNSISRYTFSRHDGTNPTARATAEAYVSHWAELRKEGGGLIFWGDVGTGKTFLAGCIANALIDQEIPVLFTSTTKILTALSGISSDKGRYLDDLNRFDLLILDDFGAERGTEYALEQITRIVDDRTKARLPLILSTNLTLNQLEESPGFRRIYSRLSGSCVPVKVAGDDHRRKQGEARIRRFRALLGEE